MSDFRETPIPQIQETRIERNKGEVTINKPEATYSIVPSVHLGKNVPEQVKSASAVVIETGDTNWSSDPVKSLLEMKAFPQYTPLFEGLEQSHQPVIFADTANENLGTEYTGLLTDHLVAASETVAGILVIHKVLKDMAEKGLTRRQILFGGAKLAVGAWLTMPLTSQLAKAAAFFTGEGHVQADMYKRVTRQTHPEAYVISEVLRNMVIAHKEQWLAEQRKDHPRFATVVGAIHTTGLEDFLQLKPQERIDFLSKFKPVIQKFYSDSFYKVGVFNYNGQQWENTETHSIPELEAIFKDGRSPTTPVM